MEKKEVSCESPDDALKRRPTSHKKSSLMFQGSRM